MLAEWPYSGNKTFGESNELRNVRGVEKAQSVGSEKHEAGVRVLRAHEDQQSKGIDIKG